jgi:predicted nucleotidyltransferase
MDKIAPEIMNAVNKAISSLKAKMPVDAVYLFGSQVSGNTTEYSDIDIAAFAPGVDNMNLDEKITIIARVRMEVDAPVEIHLFDSNRLKQARPTNIYGHIIETGKKI